MILVSYVLLVIAVLYPLSLFAIQAIKARKVKQIVQPVYKVLLSSIYHDYHTLMRSLNITNHVLDSCDLGYYLPSADGVCELCPAGSQCNVTTATGCLAGTASSSGQMDCITCPSGKLSSNLTVCLL